MPKFYGCTITSTAKLWISCAQLQTHTHVLKNMCLTFFEKTLKTNVHFKDPLKTYQMYKEVLWGTLNTFLAALNEFVKMYPQKYA